AIGAIAPEGTVLVHVVRDPRSVAASMMMGKGRKRAADYVRPDVFFEERERRKLWSSRQLSKLLMERPEYSALNNPPNYLRILLVWKHTFENTWRDARRLFGDRYVLLRNEELRADTAGAIARVYETAGREAPPQVTGWARDKVRPPEVPFAAEDERWSQAFAALDMAAALTDAGYPELAAAANEAASAAGGGRLRGLLGRR
ncbi:MAG: sulfotransferase domain-containing protein, partial [Solirubrobacterales bacterium]|nr:sulfotransferase domain-containing protein [Solirubrobacterales bacterium]